MNAKALELAVMYHCKRNNHTPICPSLVLPNRYEADVASVLKSGYLVEFEIKISVADFRKDFQKKCRHATKHGQMEGRRHGEALSRYRKCWTPNYFYFATAKGLLKPELVPDYAGIIEFDPMYVSLPTIVRKPKLLHTAKLGLDDGVKRLFLSRLTNIAVYGRGKSDLPELPEIRK